MDRPEVRNDEKRCAQIAVESILTWGEAAGIVDLPQDVARAVAADVTYRLRHSLNACGQFLRHSKRRRLTPDDVNRALKWMDVPAVHGYTGSESVEWLGVNEIGVHIPNDPTVNLASTALSEDIFHQPGSPCVRGEWHHVSGHALIKAENSGDIVPSPLPLPPEFTQYYQTLFRVIAGPSNDLFKMMCEDVATSPGIRSFVGHIVGGVVRGAERSRQKPFILRRLLLITRGLLINPHIYLGPQNYMRDLITVLVYCLIIERKLPHDTQMLRSLACNVLLQVVSREPGCWETWETVVASLSGVVASSSRPWGQHIGALIGLLTLGSPALLKSITPIARPYHHRLMHAISKSSTVTSKDIHDAHTANCLLLAGLVKVMTSFIKGLPDYLVLMSSEKRVPGESASQACSSSHMLHSGICDNEVTLEHILEIYKLGEEAFGQSFVVQLPSVYLCCTPNQVPSFLELPVYRDQTFTGDDLLERPRKKQNSAILRQLVTKFKPRRSSPLTPAHVFESFKLLSENRYHIPMNIRGCWKKPVDKLKKKDSIYPEVVPHPSRKLYARASRLTGCMPHNTFTRPLHPPLRPGYTLQYLLL